jgi:hypothetical protein
MLQPKQLIRKPKTKKVKPPKRLEMEAKEREKKRAIKQLEQLEKQKLKDIKRQKVSQKFINWLKKRRFQIQKEERLRIHKQLMLSRQNISLEDSRYEERQLMVAKLTRIDRILTVQGYIQRAWGDLICLVDLEVVLEGGNRRKKQTFYLSHIMIPFHTFNKPTKAIINNCLITQTENQIEFNAKISSYTRSDGTKDFGLKVVKKIFSGARKG